MNRHQQFQRIKLIKAGRYSKMAIPKPRINFDDVIKAFRSEDYWNYALIHFSSGHYIVDYLRLEARGSESTFPIKNDWSQITW